MDPSLVTTSDMSTACGDNLIMRVRKSLRQNLGYPKGDNYVSSNVKNLHQPVAKTTRKGDWNIECVHTLPTGFSRIIPSGKNADSDNTQEEEEEEVISSDVCELKDSSLSGWRKCDTSLGSACFVTGVVGFTMASVVVNSIACNNRKIPKLLGRRSNILKPEEVAEKNFVMY